MKETVAPALTVVPVGMYFVAMLIGGDLARCPGRTMVHIIDERAHHHRPGPAFRRLPVETTAIDYHPEVLEVVFAVVVLSTHVRQGSPVFPVVGELPF